MPRPAERAVPDAVRPADPMRAWFRFVRLHKRVSAAIGGELKALGLSIPQFDLLSTLSEREGVSQQELAERLYVTKGNVSGLVDRLVEAGLVERRSGCRDRRFHALHLTNRGRALAEQGIAAQRAYVGRTLGRLPGRDLAELERIVQDWRERARADAGPDDADQAKAATAR
jgi:DNA-binding MarR family transcriptional regulator